MGRTSSLKTWWFFILMWIAPKLEDGMHSFGLDTNFLELGNMQDVGQGLRYCLL